MTSLTLNLSRYLIYFINIVINTSSIMTSFREDVRGVAGVALATPFFQDLFYMPSRLLAILTPGYPDFWPYDLLAIRPSGHPVMQTSGHPVFWPSGHPAFWSSRLLAIWSSGHPTIRSSGHPVIRPSGHPTIRSSGHLVFWPSVSMPQKCPYWDIFGLPYCRLHQSQIPNVLPDEFELVTHQKDRAEILQ